MLEHKETNTLPNFIQPAYKERQRMGEPIEHSKPKHH